MLAVTSLSSTGYHQYGKELVRTLQENSKLPLRVYTEDEITSELTHSLRDVEGWKEFQASTVHIEPQTYLYDIRKFSHKVYAQLDAFKSGERYIVWLDGDVIVTGELTTRRLKKLVSDHFCAYFGRQQCYTETGFIIFDTQHEDFKAFEKCYREQYDDRHLFMQDYWVDCIAFDVARQGLQARNLTPDVEGMVDVFSRSPLSDVLVHDKGALKYRRGNESLQETA